MPTEIMIRVRDSADLEKVVEKIKSKIEFAEIKDIGSIDSDYWTFIYLTSLDLIPASRKMKKVVEIEDVEVAEISLG